LCNHRIIKHAHLIFSSNLACRVRLTQKCLSLPLCQNGPPPLEWAVSLTPPEQRTLACNVLGIPISSCRLKLTSRLSSSLVDEFWLSPGLKKPLWLVVDIKTLPVCGRTL